MSNNEAPQSLFVCCPICDRGTHCTIEFSRKNTSSYEDNEVWSTDYYQVLRCGGCHSFFFYHQNYFSEDNNYDRNGEPIPTIAIFPTPPSLKDTRHKLNDDILEALMEEGVGDSYASVLYGEICDAINNEHCLIGMFGIRSLLSEICRMKTKFNSTFAANLTKLEEEGFLAPKSKEVFKTIIDIGNDTIHEPKIPDINTLVLCLLTIESLVVSLFIVPKHAKELKKVAPLPKPKKQPSPAKSNAKQTKPPSSTK